MKQATVDLEAEHKKMESTLANSGSQIVEFQKQVDQLTQERTRLSDELSELLERASSQDGLSDFVDTDGKPRRKTVKEEQSRSHLRKS